MRKKILPIWIRFFSWIYLVFILAPFTYLGVIIMDEDFRFRAFGFVYYGSEFNLIGLLIVLILAMASIVAYGILWGKDWAINVGILYSIIALLMSFSSIYLNIINGVTKYNLEPFLLVPLLIILIKKKKTWESWKLTE